MRLGKLLAQTLAITLFASTHLAIAPTPSHSSPATPDAYVVDILAAPTVDEAEVEASSPPEEDPSMDLNPPVEDSSPATDEPSIPAFNLEQAPSDHSLLLPKQPLESSDSTQPTDDPTPAPSEVPFESPEPPASPESMNAPESSIAPASLLGDVIVSNTASVDYDIISAPLSTEQFHVAAVTWSGAAPLSVEIRTESGGNWGEWYALEMDTVKRPGFDGGS